MPKFTCQISLPTDDESTIRRGMEIAFPAMQWEEGDSFWDKVRVWGTAPGVMIRIYRYESPGPFDLTVALDGISDAEAEQKWLALRDQVLGALNGTVC